MLITALVFMVVLTLVAVVSMRTTTLDLKMATNTMLKSRAFEHSESAHPWVASVLDAHVFNRGFEPAWPASLGGAVPPSALFEVPEGLTVCPCPSGPPEDVWAVNNVPLEDYSAEDIQYRLDGNVDGDYDDAVDVVTDLFVTRLKVVPTAGGAMAQYSGYEGFGKATASGGAHLFLDARSRGASPDDSSAMTGSEVRIVIRN
ncbi:MAG: hypothetical protein GWN84_21625 [Gammaproteobacteria bacterium]|nr:hypothetical protein [Gammaproteobacteria bacterium]NIR85322.1 hypothetical protein [Gammaproteobacteria bacterium]NIV53287.1 hypothetical protein [Gammaproteobacteria bacterium]NIV73691.1 hypothetical protein [Gammaproteobacteria bacterium]